MEEKLPGVFLTPKVRRLCVYPLLWSFRWSSGLCTSEKGHPLFLIRTARKKWSWVPVGGIWRRCGKEWFGSKCETKDWVTRDSGKKDRRINHLNQPWNGPFLYSSFWLIQGSAGPLMRSVSHDCWSRWCLPPLESVCSQGAPVLRDYLARVGKWKINDLLSKWAIIIPHWGEAGFFCPQGRKKTSLVKLRRHSSH